MKRTSASISLGRPEMTSSRRSIARPSRRRILWLILVFMTAAACHRAAAAEPRASIRIDAGKEVGDLSPMLYGQFLEYMFQCIKGGLTAELLRNRSFDEPANAIGLSRYWEQYPDGRNDDFALHFATDDSTSYPDRKNLDTGSRERSLRVDVHPGVITRHGLWQGSIPVTQGRGYVGYLWLKSTGYEGRIDVVLESEMEGGGSYAEASIEGIRGDWRRYSFRLQPRRTDPSARFAILFAGRGRVWVDQVSLMPYDARDGVRSDVFERIVELKPAFVRWPGGNVAQDYHWLWGVGPRDQRTTWTNLSWRNEPEPSDFGTDEFLRFCRRLRTQPTLVVNIEGRGATPEEAAAWVEYCNGPASSKQGAIRAANGHPEPYGVKSWELGNEIWGSWVRGHSDTATYARNYIRYEKAMHAVDPTLELIACGDNDMDWNRTVLRDAGSRIDYLSIHHYYGTREMEGDPLNLMARPLRLERFYRSVGDMIREVVPERPIKLVINEWGLSLPVEQEYSMDAALYAGRLMNVFERSGDLVAMSAVSDLVNGWPGGIIQANRHGLFLSSTYLVNKLYATRLGRRRLESAVICPVFDTTKEGRSVPVLDVVVSRSTDGNLLFIKAVNTDRQESLETRVSLSGVNVGANGRLESVRSRSPGAFNSFATPNDVTIETEEIPAGPDFTVALPPASVSVITLTIAGKSS
jgi:alpha-N-arabinofuranosidase